VRAALETLATTPRESHPRRVAVLGDMLELGSSSADLHRQLKEAIDAAGVDLVLACGPMMKLLLDELPDAKKGAWAEVSEGIKDPLLEAVQPGDVVMIKGSLGSRMAPLVEALLARYRPEGRGE
jgi:UDP-N-acetylmuramoyl-tripeptide--D-alanyl-D-alanine ligase